MKTLLVINAIMFTTIGCIYTVWANSSSGVIIEDGDAYRACVELTMQRDWNEYTAKLSCQKYK